MSSTGFDCWCALHLLHLGLIVLVMLASGWRLKTKERVPIFLRAPLTPFARTFVYFHAIVPLLLGSVVSVIIGERGLPGERRRS